jgi:hypothetical protein
MIAPLGRRAVSSRFLLAISALLLLLLACGEGGGACSLKGVMRCDGDDLVWCDGETYRVFCSCGAAGESCEGNEVEGYGCTGTGSCPCPGDGC